MKLKTDQELVEAFHVRGEEAAFEILVRRHSTMILKVCRRVLGPTEDAEDAAQATFVVLLGQVDKLKTVRSLGAWVHRVACMVALEAKRQAARRRDRERQAGEQRNRSARGCVADTEIDVTRMVDAELNAMPGKYREAFILRHLLGRSHNEIASSLGCSASALSMRLTRGRIWLRERLARQGIMLDLGAVLALFGRTECDPQILNSLVESVVKMTVVKSGVKGMVWTTSGQVASMAKGALHTMFMAKVKMVGSALAATCLLTLGLGTAVRSLSAGEEGAAVSEKSDDESKPVKSEEQPKIPTPRQIEREEKLVAKELEPEPAGIQRRVSFQFVDTPLDEALAFMNALSKVNMILDPKVLKDGVGRAPISLTVSEVPLREALDQILEIAKLKAIWVDNCYFISKPQYLKKKVSVAPELSPQQNELFGGNLKKLGDEDFTAREQATRAIKELGRGVVPVIGETLKKKELEPEVAARLRMIVASFEEYGISEVVLPPDLAGMDQTISFEFVDTPLDEALAFISSISKLGEIKADFECPPINLRVTNMKLDLALRWILRLVNGKLVRDKMGLRVISQGKEAGPDRPGRDGIGIP